MINPNTAFHVFSNEVNREKTFIFLAGLSRNATQKQMPIN
ncbi:hypothetical protein CSC04_0068 [Enterobacter roggenkampii]|nr:hypothetical protein CSC04_0068 [Enterobacter roggenkampii]